MTEELAEAISKAITLSEVEDIYRPFKPKKRTKATIAKEKGLEPLSQIIYLQQEKKDIYEVASEYIDEEKGVATAEEAIQGALDIIAENIADDADYRKKIKSFCFREAVIETKASKEEEKSPYEMYYDFKEPILISFSSNKFSTSSTFKLLKSPFKFTSIFHIYKEFI